MLERQRASRRRYYYLRVRCNKEAMSKIKERVKANLKRKMKDPDFAEDYHKKVREKMRMKYREDDEYRERVKKSANERYHLLHPGSKRYVYSY